MPSIGDFASVVGVPAEQMVKMSEAAAVDPESRMYAQLKVQFAAKVAGVKAVADEKKRTRTRVYIQHSVDSERRYELVRFFPQFDLQFSSYDKRGAAVARAMSILIVDYMLALIQVKRGSVVVYGGSFKNMIMRKRSWVHSCYAGHVAHVQLELIRDDAAIVAMYARQKREDDTGLVSKYIGGGADVHCTTASTCTHKALVGVADFSRVDTNFRQVAYFMKAHGMRLLYFSVVGSKEMELRQEGPIPELDAYVYNQPGLICVSYKNDSEYDMTYTYTNYLELIARTTVVVEGVTYHKEFVNRINGRLVFKVTALDKVFTEPVPVYRSWVEPSYRDKYMLYAPELIEGGSVDNPNDWQMKFFTVSKDIVDTVADYGMRAEVPKDMDMIVKQRLHTRLSNYAMAGQVVYTSGVVRPDHFRSMAFIIYVHLFMQKFKDGTAMKTLTPHLRQMALLSGQSNLAVAKQYIGVVFGSIVRSTGFVMSKLVDTYRDVVGTVDIPMPSFSVCPGYVEYSQESSSNPFFVSWDLPGGDPFHGFSTHLPGAKVSGLDAFAVAAPTVASTVRTAIDPWMLMAGEAYVTDKGKVHFSDERAVVEVASGWYGSITKFWGSSGPKDFAYEPETRSSSVALVQQPQTKKATSGRYKATQLAEAISGQFGGLIRFRQGAYIEEKVYTPGVPEIIPGPISRIPLEDLRDAVSKLFPLSLTVNTANYESDLNTNPWDRSIKVLRAKLDMSRIDIIKPESFYLPLLRGHVRPGVHDTLDNTLAAVGKRNADAPKNSDNLHVDFLVSRALDSMFNVFYKPGAREWLAQQPFIGPTRESVVEWATLQSDEKLARLPEEDHEYSFLNLIRGASGNQLMVKAKLKPAMEADYMTAIKQPQTIQYDPTGKMVAVFSPVIAEKVAREQAVLKHNVLVLQGKSIDQMIEFLNGFDWRPNEKGQRKYIEIDYEQFDKSQGFVCAEGYLRKAEIFGVLPVLTQFLREHSYVRTVSAMKSGVKIWLRDQNSSGAPYTLDRNNDVNLMSIAFLLEKILDMIEFIIMMGDDILIAVRGDPNIVGWDVEVSRRFNLKMKVQIHEHGYICSMDIVHLPDGHSLLVPDIVKRSLTLMDMSVKTDENMKEKFVSFADIMKYINDPRVAQYLAVALPKRYKGVLPGMDQDVVCLLCRAFSALKVSYEDFRKLISPVKTVRF